MNENTATVPPAHADAAIDEVSAVMQAISASPNWGQAGSYVLDPVTGERVTESQWAAQQEQLLAPEVSTPPKSRKGA